MRSEQTQRTGMRSQGRRKATFCSQDDICNKEDFCDQVEEMSPFATCTVWGSSCHSSGQPSSCPRCSCWGSSAETSRMVLLGQAPPASLGQPLLPLADRTGVLEESRKVPRAGSWDNLLMGNSSPGLERGQRDSRTPVMSAASLRAPGALVLLPGDASHASCTEGMEPLEILLASYFWRFLTRRTKWLLFSLILCVTASTKALRRAPSP